MLFYNFKLFIFSIILGTLALIFNNNCDGLYKNINYKNILLMPTYLRSLAELSYGLTTNHKHEKCKLREYKNSNETKYKKKQYPKDHAKTKQNIPQVTEKENTETANFNKYKKGTYDKENEKQSNISSRSLKYLEMQRKLYNNFYVTPDIDFQKTSDKLNSKCCVFVNKKKSSDKLSSSNKVHDNYLDNLKTGYVGGIGVCALSSAATGIAGNVAAGTAVETTLNTFIGTLGIKSCKLANILYGVNLFSESAIKSAITSASLTATNGTPAATAATQAAAAASGAFGPYAIAIYIIIAIIVVLIILYMWLRKRRKNSWKYECKKHLCT